VAYAIITVSFAGFVFSLSLKQSHLNKSDVVPQDLGEGCHIPFSNPGHDIGNMHIPAHKFMANTRGEALAFIERPSLGLPLCNHPAIMIGVAGFALLGQTLKHPVIYHDLRRSHSVFLL
jgi:hypothetical protein